MPYECSHVSIKNCFFVRVQWPPGHKLHLLSELGVLEACPLGGSLKSWGTGCAGVKLLRGNLGAGVSFTIVCQCARVGFMV